jgi:glycosyltransferase involved in cell wall biosynthesis
MDKLKISACIITLNEADHIRAACESVTWADEIIVVDSGSTDATQEIAKAACRRVFDSSSRFLYGTLDTRRRLVPGSPATSLQKIIGTLGGNLHSRVR